MKAYTDDWAKLTNSDFVAGFTYASSSAYAKTINTGGCSTSAIAYTAFNYNATTGILSFDRTRNSSGREEQASDQYVIAYASGSQFVVWLGTVNGQ